MTGTLFLTDTLTAYSSGSGLWRTATSIFTRKGTLKSVAGEILGSLTDPGDIVACLPPVGTSCQVFRVRAAIGRQVTQNDVSSALEAALGKAGGAGHAVICAEPSRILLDGEAVAGSAIGKPAQQLELEVTAFLSPLPFLSSFEKAAAEADLTLAGVVALEEAAAASFKPDVAAPPHLLLVDRWHAKVMTFTGEAPSRSALSLVGSGHITSDMAVTFNLSDEKAERQALRAILGRIPADEQDAAHVALARLEELAARMVEAMMSLGPIPDEAVLLGLPLSPPVEDVFAAHGLRVRAPGLALAKTDPAILALADGAEKLGSGAVPRTAATALQLDTPEAGGSGLIEWIRRNF